MMTVRDMKKALEMAPDGAEILVYSDDMSEEISLVGPTGVAYYPKQRVLILQLEDAPIGSDEEVALDEEEPEDGSQLSKFYKPRRTQPVVVDAEFTPIVPEERGDPNTTEEKYGAEA